MTTPVTVRLDDNVAENVAHLADDLDRSVSWVVGQAVQLYLQGRSFTPPPMPDGVEGFVYEITGRFTLAPYDSADQLAHAISDRLPAWLRQQGAANAYLLSIGGVRSLEARGRAADRWPDPADPVDGLREANALERARSARAAAEKDPSRRRPLEESIAIVDARRAARGEVVERSGPEA